jgi:hypothetical protein
MSIIDKQRIAGVKALEALGYTFSLAEGWTLPAGAAQIAGPAKVEADAMHALLLVRADKIAGCSECSDEATELKLITKAAEAYESKRWPNGKSPGWQGLSDFAHPFGGRMIRSG